MRAVVVAICSCVASAALGQPATAGDPSPLGQRPTAAKRIARVFDFEEFGANPTPVPAYWVRGQDDPAAGRERHGFPIWNAAELDDKVAFRGKASVRLPIDGGSASLLLEKGVLPVFQNADYLVSAMVKTQGLQHARARIVVRFLDRAGEPIRDSEAVSDAVVSPTGWTEIAVDLEGRFDNAAYAQIDLQVVQPEEQGGPNPLGARQIWPQDYKGAAWFDDVTIAQLPRIELSSASPCNIFAESQAPELAVVIRDLTGESLRARVAVYDGDGRLIDSLERPVSSGRSRASFRPRLPGLGWYRAILTVNSAERVVGDAWIDFAWLPGTETEWAPAAGGNAGTTPDARRFELVSQNSTPELQPSIAEAARRMRVGALTLSIGEGKQPLLQSGDVDDLLRRGCDVAFALPRLPQALADEARIDAADPWSLVASGGAAWTQPLLPYMDRYGQTVRRWQIGAVGDEQPFWSLALGDWVAHARSGLAQLVPGPAVMIPWRADREPVDGRAGDPHDVVVQLFYPNALPAQGLAPLAQTWSTGPGAGPWPRVSLVLEQPDKSRYGFRGSAAETVRRMAWFWSSFVGQAPADPQWPRVAIADPWIVSEGRRPTVMPGPELAAFAAAARELRGRRVVGELPCGDGIRCLILATGSAESQSPGALLAWREALPDAANEAIDRPEYQTTGEIAGYFGPGPLTVIDLWGNRAPAPLDPRAAGLAYGRNERRNVVRIPVSDEPVFIEGIDTELALFFSRLAIDPPAIEATGVTHEHAIQLANTWTAPLDVSLSILQPGGVDRTDQRKDRSWRISPRTMRTVIPVGGSAHLPITIDCSPGEEAGIKKFVFSVELVTSRTYGAIQVVRDVPLWLPTLRVEAVSIVEGGDVVIEVQVSSTSGPARDLELTAFAPGQPRAKQSIAQLGAGATVTRRFAYPGAYGALKGKRVYVAVTEPGASARLNRAVSIE